MNLTNLEEYKCEKGISIKYYRKFFLNIFPISIVIILILYIILVLDNSVSITLNNSILYFFVTFAGAIFIIITLAYQDRDVIFDLEKDDKITVDEYIEIFNERNYKLISKNPNKCEFNKYIRVPGINCSGFIEFLNDKIRIKATLISAYSIEGEITRLQYKHHLEQDNKE